MTPPRVFSCKFTPEHPQTAASVLSLIKLQIYTESNFFAILSQSFCSISQFKKFSLFYHKELGIRILSMQGYSSCKHNSAIFYQHRNPFNFVSNILFFIMYLACGWNCGGNFLALFEMKL